MAMAKDYNGWKNYETWCINLWLSNDEPLYRDIRELAAQHPQRRALALMIREYVEAMIDEHHLTGFIADLVNASVGETDFEEIADAWLDQ